MGFVGFRFRLSLNISYADPESLEVVVDCYSHCWILNCSMFCSVFLCVHSSFTIIVMGKREFFCFVCRPGVL